MPSIFLQQRSKEILPKYSGSFARWAKAHTSAKTGSNHPWDLSMAWLGWCLVQQTRHHAQCWMVWNLWCSWDMKMHRNPPPHILFLREGELFGEKEGTRSEMEQSLGGCRNSGGGGFRQGGIRGSPLSRGICEQIPSAIFGNKLQKKNLKMIWRSSQIGENLGIFFGGGGRKPFAGIHNPINKIQFLNYCYLFTMLFIFFNFSQPLSILWKKIPIAFKSTSPPLCPPPSCLLEANRRIGGVLISIQKIDRH